jgi:hypothetical protein
VRRLPMKWSEIAESLRNTGLRAAEDNSCLLSVVIVSIHVW